MLDSRKLKRKWKTSSELRQYVIIIVAALVLSIVAVVVSNIVDRDVESYYPHDDALEKVKTE